MRKLLILGLLFVIVNSTFSQIESVDYFGLTRPSVIAESFSSPELSLEGSFVFNASYNVPRCDEFYFTKVENKENIYFTKRDKGKWNQPEIATFSDPSFHDADPFFALNGSRVYFVSTRPTSSTDTQYDYNIWYADRDKSGWKQSEILPEPINSVYEEFFFSISDSGNAYFASNRPGGFGSFDIYKTQIMKDGKMSKPINMGEPVNSQFYEYDPYISLDENHMILSIQNKPDRIGRSDIYFTWRNNRGKWSKPINMGDRINTSKEDFGSAISPDSQYIIFSNGGLLKWVSVEVLEILKSENK